MEQRKLFEAPEFGEMLFSLKEVTYTPDTPRMNEPFAVKGKVELLKIPFLLPIWVVVTAEYPESWWEEIVPIIGAPQERKSDMVIGGDFEVSFPAGFKREGEFKLTVSIYAGPTMTVNNWTLPPFPPVAKYETVFTVSGEIEPPEVAWNIMEEVTDIIVEAGPSVTIWQMMEEVSGIVVEPAPKVAVWKMIEEVPGIVVEPAPKVTIWEIVEEVPGIVVEPIAPMVGWKLVEEIRGIVVAPMVLREYSITTRVSPSGVGRVTKEPYKTKYAPGEIVKLTAYPYSGYEFDCWDCDGEFLGSANPINFLVVAMDRTITAHFEKVEVPTGYSLTVNAYPSYAGRVTKEPDKALYAPGETVRVTGHAYSGYTAEAWYLDGEYWSYTYGTEPYINFLIVNKSHTLTLHFREI